MTTDSKAVIGGAEFTDLAEQIGRKLEWAGPNFPNYGDLDVPLPAGHWRAIRAVLASTAGAGAEPQVVRDVARMVREKAGEIRLIIDRHTSPRGSGIYMASKTAHAPEWRRLRAEGLPIISTWIDEAGKGETACFTDLWQRCVDEAATASVVIVYRQPGEVLKGAFVEAGAALACGVPVLAVGCDEFSFSNHAGVERLGTLHAALDRARQILVELPATEAPAVPASPRSGEPLERVRHVKRGTEYEVLGEAEAQVSKGPRSVLPAGVDPMTCDGVVARDIHDGSRLTVYRCLKTGKLWCRFTDEMRDGRFVPAAPAQSPSTSEGATDYSPGSAKDAEINDLASGIYDAEGDDA